MKCNSCLRYGFIALLVFSVGRAALAQVVVNGGADTPESAALRGGGQFLRGLGWYNLNTARTNAVNTDTQIRWAREMRHIQAEERANRERVASGKKLKEEEIRARLRQKELELRTAPTQDDIRSGAALNVLLCDLMDPRITSEQWQAKSVPLPEGVSVKDMVFKFIRSSSGAPVPGVIALSRLNIARKWPTVLNYDDLNLEKSAYEVAYATVRKQVLEDKFKPDSVGELDKSLNALNTKVTKVVPLDRGYRSEATHFVNDLRDATRMFDARTVEYAKELLVDTEDHDATTVAELVAFTLKYRFQFGSAERSPSAQALYPRLYEVMGTQVKALGIQPDESDNIDQPLDVESIVKGYTADCQRARKKILASFDERIEAAKKDSKLKPNEKQSRIALLTAEKKSCTNNGSMPFSPAMRSNAMAYLDELKAAQKSALESMKKLSKEDFASGEKRIAAVKVGVWKAYDDGFEWTMFTDRTESVGGKAKFRLGTWELNESAMVVRHPSPHVKGGVYIMTCDLDEDGMGFSVTNRDSEGTLISKGNGKKVN